MKNRQKKKNRKKAEIRSFPPLICGANRPVAWYFQLDSIKGQEDKTNSATIFSRPVLEYDESGEHGFERFATVTLTRAKIAEILSVLEADIADMRKYCPDSEFI